MKATLKFTLPKESYEYRQAALAANAWLALRNVDNELRSLLKHGHNYKSVEELAQHIREEIACVHDIE